MTPALGRGVLVLVGLLLASCSFPNAASVLEDEHLDLPPESNGSSAPSVLLVRETQQLLAELGYGAGPPDGLVGPKTLSALAQFQGDYGVSAPPRLSEELVVQLRYVACFRNGTAATVSTTDCDTLLQPNGVHDLARLSSSTDFIEASELVAVGLPIIMIPEELADYGRVGYRGDEGDEGDPGSSGGADVASSAGEPSGGSNGGGSTESSQADSSGETEGSDPGSGKGNKGGKGGKGGKGKKNG